jgi:hypothetical protein
VLTDKVLVTTMAAARALGAVVSPLPKASPAIHAGPRCGRDRAETNWG